MKHLCKFVLTEQEKADFGKTQSSLLLKNNELSYDKKLSAREFKKQIDDNSKEISRIATAIDTGVEEREVECKRIIDTIRNEVRFVSEETGEVLDTISPIPTILQSAIDDEIKEYED